MSRIPGSKVSMWESFSFVYSRGCQQTSHSKNYMKKIIYEWQGHVLLTPPPPNQTFPGINFKKNWLKSVKLSVFWAKFQHKVNKINLLLPFWVSFCKEKGIRTCGVQTYLTPAAIWRQVSPPCTNSYTTATCSCALTCTSQMVEKHALQWITISAVVWHFRFCWKGQICTLHS